MKSKINPYLILNVPEKANGTEIKKTFLSLARKYHPDKNKGNKLAERRFKQINEAYQLLSDPQKRQSFDQELAQEKASAVIKEPPVKPQPKPSFSKKLFFSGREEKPLDLVVPFSVSLEDICQKKSFHLNYLKPLNGIKQKTALSLQLPEGVSEGTKLKFKGKGGGNGRKILGDLYVQITFNPHKLFTVKGKDIYLDLPLNFFDAFLLKEIKVPTVYGQAVLKIPDEISSNSLLRLKNMGLPKNQAGKKGDMFVRLITEFPTGHERKIKKEFFNIKRLPKDKIQQLYKNYENQEELFPKASQYKTLFLKLLKERKKTN